MVTCKGQFKKRDRLCSYHPEKIEKIRIFPLCPVEKFKFSEFLLDDKNATYLSSESISTLASRPATKMRFEPK